MEMLRAMDHDLAKLRFMLGWSFVVNCMEFAMVGAGLQQIADYLGDAYGMHKYIFVLSLIAATFIRLNPYLPKTFHLLQDLITDRITTITGEVTSIKEVKIMREHYLLVSINNEEFTIEKSEFTEIHLGRIYTIRYFSHSHLVSSIEKN